MAQDENFDHPVVSGNLMHYWAIASYNRFWLRLWKMATPLYLATERAFKL